MLPRGEHRDLAEGQAGTEDHSSHGGLMPRSLLLLILVAAACHRNPGPGSPQTACVGQRVLIVSNRGERDVEVHAYVNGARILLGGVPARGSEHFPMPPGAISASYREQGTGRAPRKGTVGGRYECREVW